ncbi:hypothetical protein F7R91_21145 [Streptomyces luteolifulvus]|uniref:HEAT repeat domain-containing protein n=1 Tax=Streptomyces luteolifulvus TaxID=2615112 RepID=A0A6H9UYS7_9ACTN|nr:hypothetical protein [Streptomyces luteolifulvus]KAB1144743.1 hypothetical protein F7R91_21145 [Streptomyces luteolifulvus]
MIDAMGLSGDREFSPLLGRLLDDQDLRGRAALALARLGDRRWSVPIAERLTEVGALQHAAFTVALELMGDRAAVPGLLRWLHEGRGSAGDVHHALVRLTGRDPLIPLWSTGEEFAGHARRIWADLALDATVPPRIADLRVDSSTRVRFTLDEGRGRIRIDYAPPPAGSAWPRWDKALFVGGQPLYRISSDCGTCETTMRSLGWPPAVHAVLADQVRAYVSHVDQLGAELFEALGPLLLELQTGHYQVLLVDLPLERVSTAERSWWVRRWEQREDEDPWGEPDVTVWPGTDHFQLRERIAGTMPTYGVVLPSQRLATADTGVVARWKKEIDSGGRPAALALAWVEDRYVQAEHEERFLVATVLDGHHKLLAYAEAGVPARVVVLARLEDNWTPGATWGAGLEEVVARLPAPTR